MNIDEIRELLKSGDVAGAENAAKAALENDPDNICLGETLFTGKNNSSTVNPVPLPDDGGTSPSEEFKK